MKGDGMHLFSSVAEVSGAIREAGLGQWHDQLFSLIRPTVRYIADAGDSHTAIGASRIGGTPDLPSTLQWPIRPPYPDADVRNIEVRDHPAKHLRSREQRERDRRRDEIIGKVALLPFIAQIDLAEASRKQQFDIDLPSHGRLLFFYDARETPYGFDPSDAIGFRVIWDESPISALVRAGDPEELSIDSLILPANTLCPTAGFMLPHRESFAYDALDIPVGELNRYSKLSWPYGDDRDREKAGTAGTIGCQKLKKYGIIIWVGGVPLRQWDSWNGTASWYGWDSRVAASSKRR